LRSTASSSEATARSPRDSQVDLGSIRLVQRARAERCGQFVDSLERPGGRHQHETLAVIACCTPDKIAVFVQREEELGHEFSRINGEAPAARSAQVGRDIDRSGPDRHEVPPSRHACRMRSAGALVERLAGWRNAARMPRLRAPHAFGRSR